MSKPHPPPPLPKEDLEHIADHTAALWEEARGKSFFITGGTGFFGMWLLESFAHVNDRLGLQARATILSRDPAAFAGRAPHLGCRQDLAFIQGELRDFPFPPGSFDYVIHAATQVSARSEASEEVRDAIIAGTRRVLEFAAHAGIGKLLLTSSGAVYGNQPPDLTHISEDFRGRPDTSLPSSAYGEGKRISEVLAMEHGVNHGYEVRIARCFAFVGPHLPLDGNFAIGNFIRDALAGTPIRINGDGSPRRSYLYAADLAIWLWTLLFRPAPSPIYNVGSSMDISIAELANLVKHTLASSSPVEIAEKKDDGKPVLRYVPCVRKAARELELGVSVSLANAISKTAAWHQQQPFSTHFCPP